MKLDVIMHYNVDEKTGEITYIGKEEVTVDTAKTASKASKSSSSKKVDESPDPIVTLDNSVVGDGCTLFPEDAA